MSVEITDEEYEKFQRIVSEIEEYENILKNCTIADASLDILRKLRKDYLYPEVRMAFETHLFYLIDCNRDSEAKVQQRFFELLNNYLPNAKIIKKKFDKHHIPDGYVIYNNKEAPVEIKFDKFNGAALRQLQRYMKFYNCEIGIAVAKQLTCKLPPSIKFINYEVNC